MYVYTQEMQNKCSHTKGRRIIFYLKLHVFGLRLQSIGLLRKSTLCILVYIKLMIQKSRRTLKMNNLKTNKDKKACFAPNGWASSWVLCGNEKNSSVGDQQMAVQFLFHQRMVYNWKNIFMLQVTLITVNYTKLSMCSPSFRSTAEERVTTPFTALSSVSCVIADTFWWMISSSAASDAGQSW